MLRRVHTTCGLLQGVPCGDPRVTVFKGVPYAQPPVGNLRWKAPQPPLPWEGVRMADTFPPIGYQDQPGVDPSDFWTKELNPAADQCVVSEDCLYLNIWSPARAADEKLPVYMWIHGGGLESGYSWEMEFDGERMARQGMIFITVGYRLNVFGLFYHEGCGSAAGNFCFRDMIAALEWIKGNIAAFGGDPDRITIGGQSGGALAVQGLITSPRTNELITGAIAQSGGGLRAFGYGPTTATAAAAQAKGELFLQTLGCSTVDQARLLPAETVYRAFRQFTRAHGRMQPAVDGELFLEDFTQAMLNDHHHPIPYLFGSTRGECPGTPAAPPAPQTVEQFHQLVRQVFADQADEFLRCFPADTMEQVHALLKSDCFNIRTIAVRAYAVHQARQQRGGYFYLFDAPIPGEDHPGSYHGSDMWFTFNSLAKCWRPFTGMHYDLAYAVSGYIANFVKTGDPNGCDQLGRPLPRWEAYTTADPFYLEITDHPAREAYPPDDATRFRVAYHLSTGLGDMAPPF